MKLILILLNKMFKNLYFVFLVHIIIIGISYLTNKCLLCACESVNGAGDYKCKQDSL